MKIGLGGEVYDLAKVARIRSLTETKRSFEKSILYLKHTRDKSVTQERSLFGDMIVLFQNIRIVPNLRNVFSRKIVCFPENDRVR